jgi:hypothetical protein
MLGKDPSSDFRGMGVLGLHQLVYFSEMREHDSKLILLESNHSRRFFPFAATGTYTLMTLPLAQNKLLNNLLIFLLRHQYYIICNAIINRKATS